MRMRSVCGPQDLRFLIFFSSTVSAAPVTWVPCIPGTCEHQLQATALCASINNSNNSLKDALVAPARLYGLLSRCRDILKNTLPSGTLL